MKTTLYFATLVAVLFSLGFVTQSTYGQTPGTRVAVIDIAYILKTYEPFKAQRDQSKKDRDDLRRWAATETEKIRAEMSKLQQYKTGSPEYKQTEERIAEMQLRLRLDGAKREKALIEKDTQAYYATYKQIERVVADFAFRNQIGLVLRFNREDIDPTNNDSIMRGINRLVIFQNRLDITDIVLENLPRVQVSDRRGDSGPPPIPPR